jgi:CIC family chloride channel protein
MLNNKLQLLLTRVGPWAVGGLLGGLIGSLAAVLLTEAIKQTLRIASDLGNVWLLLLPLVGVTLAVLVLFGLGRGQPVQTLAPRGQLPLVAGVLSWTGTPSPMTLLAPT